MVVVSIRDGDENGESKIHMTCQCQTRREN
jgi:hypothetical protein